MKTRWEIRQNVNENKERLMRNEPKKDLSGNLEESKKKTFRRKLTSNLTEADLAREEK